VQVLGFQPRHTARLHTCFACHCRTPDNPDGYICMAVAENRLSTDLVEAGLKQHALDWPGSMLFYQDARGIQELRASLARMAQRTFMQVRSSAAAQWLRHVAHVPQQQLRQTVVCRGAHVAMRRVTCGSSCSVGEPGVPP
jgi:hypothetical protein